jgi:hypothetical protein
VRADFDTTRVGKLWHTINFAYRIRLYTKEYNMPCGELSKRRPLIIEARLFLNKAEDSAAGATTTFNSGWKSPPAVFPKNTRSYFRIRATFTTLPK